jgi:F-box/leucine-rich repeat protein 2/20
VACLSISSRGFSEAVRKLSRLEELDISRCDLYEDCLEVIGMSCPLLKSLKFCKKWIPYPVTDDDDDEALIISETMSRLSCLDIKGNRLTNVGLLAILDGCPLLECLDIQECYNLSLGESLRKRCIEKIKDLRLPILNYNYVYEDFDDEYDDPVTYHRDLDADDYYEEYNEYDDLYFYDDFYDPLD